MAESLSHNHLITNLNVFACRSPVRWREVWNHPFSSRWWFRNVRNSGWYVAFTGDYVTKLYWCANLSKTQLACKSCSLRKLHSQSKGQPWLRLCVQLMFFPLKSCVFKVLAPSAGSSIWECTSDRLGKSHHHSICRLVDYLLLVGRYSVSIFICAKLSWDFQRRWSNLRCFRDNDFKLSHHILWTAKRRNLSKISVAGSRAVLRCPVPLRAESEEKSSRNAKSAYFSSASGLPVWGPWAKLARPWTWSCEQNEVWPFCC